VGEWELGEWELGEWELGDRGLGECGSGVSGVTSYDSKQAWYSFLSSCSIGNN
jgi:hypothetical protein